MSQDASIILVTDKDVLYFLSLFLSLVDMAGIVRHSQISLNGMANLIVGKSISLLELVNNSPS